METHTKAIVCRKQSIKVGSINCLEEGKNIATKEVENKKKKFKS